MLILTEVKKGIRYTGNIPFRYFQVETAPQFVQVIIIGIIPKRIHQDIITGYSSCKGIIRQLVFKIEGKA